MILVRALEKVVKAGSIALTDATGKTHLISGSEDGHHVAIRLHDKSLHRKLLTNPFLHVGEAYMEGKIEIRNGRIYDLLDLIGMNIDNEYLKYTSYLLPALVTSLILAAVFAPLFIYLFDNRAIPAAFVVTLPTSLYYLNVSAWPLKWFFFNIESFLLMITFYLVIKLYFAFKHNPHGTSE